MPLIDELYMCDADAMLQKDFNKIAQQMVRRNEDILRETIANFRHELTKEQARSLDIIVNRIDDLNQLKLHLRFQEGTMYGLNLIDILKNKDE